MTAPVIRARPVTYRGIEMRSRLEGYFAAWLDSQPGVTWQYEQKCFAGPPGQWLMDFAVTHGAVHPKEEPWTEYAEVKPWSLAPVDRGATTAAVDAVLTQMEVAWLSEVIPLGLYITDVRGGKVSRVLRLSADYPGCRWTIENPVDGDSMRMWPGLGQHEATAGCLTSREKNRALNRHGRGRMAALGVTVPDGIML